MYPRPVSADLVRLFPLADVVVPQPEVPAGERPEAPGGRDHPNQVSAAGQDGPRHACADGSHGNVRR